MTPEQRFIETQPHDRFWAQVEKTANCWLWTGRALGPANSEPYGYIHAGSEPTDKKRKYKTYAVRVHRLSYSLHTGKYLDRKTLVCHSCDMPLCVNPAHLFVGTHKDNTADAKRKGRFFKRGAARKMCRVTEADVRAIRSLYARGQHTMKAIAKLYAISFSATQAIISRKTWAWIP